MLHGIWKFTFPGCLARIRHVGVESELVFRRSFRTSRFGGDLSTQATQGWPQIPRHQAPWNKAQNLRCHVMHRPTSRLQTAHFCGKVQKKFVKPRDAFCPRSWVRPLPTGDKGIYARSSYMHIAPRLLGGGPTQHTSPKSYVAGFSCCVLNVDSEQLLAQGHEPASTPFVSR